MNQPLVQSVPDQTVLSEAPRQGRIFYDWIMLGVAILALAASSPRQTYVVSIFNEPMRQSLGLSHSQLALAYMLGTLLAALPITWIGSLMDRYGLRRMLIVVVTVFAVACIVAALSTSWLTLFVAFFLLRLLGPGALAFLSGNILAHWFHRRLRFVEGLRQLGMAFAMGFIPSLNLWLVQTCGWRGAYATLGIVVWCLMMPIAVLVFRNRPEDVGQMLDGVDAPQPATGDDPRGEHLSPNLTLSQAIRTSTFWIVVGGTAWFGLVQTAIFFSLVPILNDRGLTEQDAARLMAAFAVSLGAMHLIGGHLADHIEPPVLLSTGMVGFGLSLCCLYATQSMAMSVACGVMMGISQGLHFGASHPLWARYFGRLHLGKIRGALMTLIVASSSLGPLIVGVVRDATGTFDAALLAFAVLPWPLAACSLWASAPTRPTV